MSPSVVMPGKLVALNDSDSDQDPISPPQQVQWGSVRGFPSSFAKTRSNHLKASRSSLYESVASGGLSGSPEPHQRLSSGADDVFAGHERYGIHVHTHAHTLITSRPDPLTI